MKYFQSILLIITTAVLLQSNDNYADDWEYQIEPYLLVSSIDGDASIGRVTGVPVDVGFDDILETLDFGAMLHYEAHHSSGWGFALDYGLMDLSADISGPRGGIVDASVRQAVFEALAIRNYESDDSNLAVTFGFRWWNNDLDVLIDSAILPGSTGASTDPDWLDLVVGFRYDNKLNNQWTFVASGDVGGLDSDNTYSLAAGFHYDFGNQWSLDLRYKALWVDYETGRLSEPGYFAYDTVTHGPVIGAIYTF